MRATAIASFAAKCGSCLLLRSFLDGALSMFLFFAEPCVRRKVLVCLFFLIVFFGREREILMGLCSLCLLPALKLAINIDGFVVFCMLDRKMGRDE